MGYFDGMKKNPTAPVVITDTNGKVTTVHRKVGEQAKAQAKLPAVTLNAMSTNEPAPDFEDLYMDLLNLGESTSSSRLVFQAKSAFFRKDVETMSILTRFPGNGGDDPSYVVQGINLLREYGDDPETALSNDTLAALCRVRRELMFWEMKYDNDKSGDIEHGAENRDAIVLLLIENPKREDLIIHCLKERAVGDATEIMNFEPEFNKVHRSLSDGLL